MVWPESNTSHHIPRHQQITKQHYNGHVHVIRTTAVLTPDPPSARLVYASYSIYRTTCDNTILERRTQSRTCNEQPNYYYKFIKCLSLCRMQLITIPRSAAVTVSWLGGLPSKKKNVHYHNISHCLARPTLSFHHHHHLPSEMVQSAIVPATATACFWLLMVMVVYFSYSFSLIMH